MAIYDVNGNVIPTGGGAPSVVSDDINCKIIAHRGYHASVPQNTLAAFLAASDAGFTWVEIDVRKCADGIYVCAHDNGVTLYNNGVATSLYISGQNYSTIKGYTWDADGEYKISTLQSLFNSMHVRDMKMIVDRKSGTNEEILALAALCGCTDRIIISYGSYSDAYADRNLLHKYDAVKVRVYPSNYADFLTLAAEITNPLYTDMNVSGSGANFGEMYSLAFSVGLPILYSGCTTGNTKKWCATASGVMANLDTNISYSDFYEMLDVDYDKATAITPSANSLSLAVSGTDTLSGTCDVTSPGGYVYLYSLNPAVAKVSMTAWGTTGTATITGVSAGSTKIRLFNGCGATVDVPVTVS